MSIVLNCHNVAKHIEFYVGQLWFGVIFIGKAGCFKKELYNGIPNVAVWRVLRKRLCLVQTNFQDACLSAECLDNVGSCYGDSFTISYIMLHYVILF
jgi:hypothetical protein